MWSAATCRRFSSAGNLNAMIADIRYSLRALLKQPGFTIITVLTLALGIGACTAMFSVVNAVLLRPLPFASSGRLVILEGTKSTLSYPDFSDIRAQQNVFDHLAAYRTRSFTMVDSEGAVRLRGTIATSGLFRVLSSNALYGRTFTSEEDSPGGGRSLILSYALWKNHYSSDPNVVGRAVELNGESHVIAGVMPAGFQYPIEADPTEIWVNFARDRENTGQVAISSQRGNRYLNAIGLLKSAVTAPQADAQVRKLASQLEARYPRENAGFGVTVTPLLEKLTGNIRRPLWMVLAAVSLVLVIACVNVAALMLARGWNRRREVAVCAALGASNWRVTRTLLVESLLLTIVSGVLGIAIARFGIRLLIAFAPADVPRVGEAAVDGSVLSFCLIIAAITGLCLGIAPAWQARQLDLYSALKQRSRRATGSRARLRSGLVVGQVAIAVVLLATAALLIQSLVHLLKVSPGFETAHLMTLRVGLADGTYSRPEQIAQFHERLMSELESVPGVSDFSTSQPLPFTGSIRVGFNIDGRAKVPGNDFPYETRLFLVGSDYFRTMGIPLHEGREYSAQDSLDATQVAIVNETFARTFFPGESTIGRRINPAMSAGNRSVQMREIVGIVADTRSKNLSEAAQPEVYLHLPQCPATSSFSLLLRFHGNPKELPRLVRETVARLDRNVPVSNIRVFEDYIADSLKQPRFYSMVLGVFAAVALLLTSLGIYGLLAFLVSERTGEIGLRLAIGAGRPDIFRLIVLHGMKLVLPGILLGLCASAILTRVVKHLLYGIEPNDPATFLSITLLLIVVAVVACAVPAQRAARLDPLKTLRQE